MKKTAVKVRTRKQKAAAKRCPAAARGARHMATNRERTAVTVESLIEAAEQENPETFRPWERE